MLLALTLILWSTLIALLILAALKLYTQLNHWQYLGIPCEQPHPLYGNMNIWTNKTSFHELTHNYYRKFKGTGPFAGFYWMIKPAAFILDPSLIKQILIKDFSNFADRGFYSNVEDDPLTGQLFVLDGFKWKFMRNKLTPTFTSAKLKYMFPTMVKVGEEFVSTVDEMLKQSSVLEAKDVAGRFTLNLIGRCAFGIELTDSNKQFVEMSQKSTTEFRYGKLGVLFVNLFPKLSRRLHIKQTPEDIEKFFMGIIRDTVEHREKNNIRRNDFMDLLIDLKNEKVLKTETDEELRNLTFDEIAAQAFLFLNAGYENSATLISFTLYELARHPEIQQRASEEICSVLKQNKGEFTYECLKEMKYLDQIVSESLRLYMLVPMLSRQCLQDYPVPGYPNYVILKGMMVIIPASSIQRDPDYYPDPDTFNPDNFSAEAVKQRDSVAWLPFGDGPRNCIAARFAKVQTLIGLAFLLKHFKFSVCSKTQIPIKLDRESFLLKSESGIYLEIEKA